MARVAIFASKPYSQRSPFLRAGMRLLLNWVLSALAVWIVAHVVPGFYLRAAVDDAGAFAEMGLGTRCLAGPQSLPFLFAENATEMAELAGPLQPLAAIHHDHFAVDVAGTVAHEERGKIGEFLDRAEPPHGRSEEHTSELQSLRHLVCRLLLEKKKKERVHPHYRATAQTIVTF